MNVIFQIFKSEY